MSGCAKDDAPVSKKTKVKIAVVLSEKSKVRWDRIMELAQKNISEVTDICPVFEFYEENSHDMIYLAHDLAHDNSIISVVGCESEENTQILAHQMSRARVKKPMFTFNTSQSVIRQYSNMGFMWGLCESDITQSEILLSQIKVSGFSDKVTLIAGDDSYGETFTDWFAFQAKELDLTPERIYRYSDTTQIKQYMEELSGYTGNLLCIPKSHDDAVCMVQNTSNWYTFYSHKAMSEKVIDKLIKKGTGENYLMFGTTLVADPGSGFDIIYENKYGEKPIFGEPQLYDAIMVTCLGYAFSKKLNTTVNNAVATLLGRDSKGLGDWGKNGIRYAYSQIQNEMIPAISGATGDLCFTPKKHSIIQYSTYAVQYMTEFKFHNSDFVSRKDGQNTSSINGAWEWEKILIPSVDDADDELITTPIKGNKAVVIATSSGWKNYRHQADALAFYQLLKSNGLSDNDILLIIADDLADEEQNPQPDIIIREIGGNNLYEDVVVDYNLSKLTPKKLKEILLTSFDSTDEDNLLLFWSGHGKPGCLVWNGEDKTVTGEFLNGLISEMSEQKKFRQLLCIIEACYAGSVAKHCEGTPGVLLMTAANDMETSKAENYNSVWQTYLTNSFTSAVLSSLPEPESGNIISIHDLYSEAYKKTMGSHVTLYNAKHFGSLTENYFEDFYTQHASTY